jgi:hypothetical protein
VTQMVSAERAAALRNKCLNLAKTCRSGSGPASERTSQSRQWDTLARFLAILSGRRRSAAAKLGWIVVARGLVLEDRRKAWVHTLTGTNDDMSRFGMMHPCGVGRSTEGEQKAEGQNTTHRICSNRPTPVFMWCAGRTAAICTGSKIAQPLDPQDGAPARHPRSIKWLTAVDAIRPTARPAPSRESGFVPWHRCEVRDVRYLVAISGKADVADIAFL